MNHTVRPPAWGISWQKVSRKRGTKKKGKKKKRKKRDPVALTRLMNSTAAKI